MWQSFWAISSKWPTCLNEKNTAVTQPDVIAIVCISRDCFTFIRYCLVISNGSSMYCLKSITFLRKRFFTVLTSISNTLAPVARLKRQLDLCSASTCCSKLLLYGAHFDKITKVLKLRSRHFGSDHLQSISNACPCLPITDMNWSIIPQGIPGNLCSASWQARAFVFKLGAETARKQDSRHT